MDGSGPYAEADRHGADDVATRPWRVLGPGDVPGRVDAVRAALAGSCGGRPVPVRVAASIAQLGLVARLVAPVLARVAVTGRSPLLSTGSVWWQPVLGGPFPLSLPGGDVEPARGVQILLDGLVGDLTEASARLSVSRKVLWGNVASAVNGAAGQLAARSTELRPQAVEAAGLFLRHPALAGAADGEPVLDFRRRSCCLIYRLADRPGDRPTDRPGRRPERAGVCADCVLG